MAWRRWARVLIKIVAGIVAIPFVYLLAALVLGAIPVNRGWQQPAEGVTIFVRSNGVHTWIMMPAANDYMDWRPYAPAEHLRDPRWGNANHVAIGYGNRDFYLNTPTWGDLSVRTAAGAIFGIGPALLHVEYHQDPRADAWTRELRVTPDEYRRLVAFIRPRFRLDAQGRTIPVLGRGFGPNDMFYEATGGYSAILTCNEWTARALRAAGVRMGLWTPFAQGIMWRLD